MLINHLIYYKNVEELERNPHLNKYDKDLLKNSITEFYTLLLYYNDDNGEEFSNEKNEENLEFLEYFHNKDFYKLIKKEKKRTIDRINQSKQKFKTQSNNSIYTKIKTFFSFDFSNNGNESNTEGGNGIKLDSFQVIENNEI